MAKKNQELIEFIGDKRDIFVDLFKRFDINVDEVQVKSERAIRAYYKNSKSITRNESNETT